MNKIKTLLPLFFMALLMMAFTSCEEEKDNPNPLASTTGLPSVSAQSLEFVAAGGTDTITVQGGTAFVRCDADWVTVTRLVGNVAGNDTYSTYQIVCAQNKDTLDRQTGILVNLDGAYTTIPVTQQSVVAKPDKEYEFHGASTVASLMYPGWNLGNTLEGTSNMGGLADETGWQSTKTTKEIIDFVRAQGFNSVRIPCSWSRHMDANNKIDADWMARVKEVVDYCVDNGLFVVLNDHYDENWIENSMSSYDETKAAKLKTMWIQIARAFKNYDEHLLFAGLNEPACETQDNTNNLVKYENDFISAVRSTKGNNANRVLVVQGPSTDIDKTYDWYSLPTDEKSGAMMVEVHYYNPPQFTGVWEGTGAFWFWGKDNLVDGDTHNSTSNEDYLIAQFQKMSSKFWTRGIPVILGEYGANWRNVGTTLQAKHDASIKLWYKLVNKYATQNHMVPFAWDINVANQNGTTGVMTIINRSNKTVFCTPAMEGITEGCKDGWGAN